MKKWTSWILIIVLCINMFGVNIGFAEESKLWEAKDIILQLVQLTREFADTVEHWANKFIAKLYDDGLIKGYPDGTFRPDNTITVAEFTKILVSALGYDNLGNSDSGHWSLNYVNKAKELEIIKNGDFSNKDLDRNITRAEIAMMISRSLQEEPNNVDKIKNNITDINSISDKYIKHVLRVYAAGIVTGYEDGSFRPKGETTRAEASTMIVRLLDKKERIIPELKDNEENEEGYKDVTEIAEKELLTNYIPDEDNGILEYRVGNRCERVKYVYKISTSDLPVKIGEHILYSIEPEIEIVGTGKNPTFIVHQTVIDEVFYDGLYMNIADKDYKVLRPRNNYGAWTPKNAPTPIIDKYGNKIYKTYYGVIVLDDLPDWKTYRGKDAYNLIFNDAKSDYAVIVENALNK